MCISGLQVDGSPPIEDFPPTFHDLAIFKDIDYYGVKAGKEQLAGKSKRLKKSAKARCNVKMK